MNPKEKTIVITGGSRGLGRALAFEFGARGARVAIVARGREQLESTLAELRKRGHEASAVVADPGDKRAIHRIAGQISD